MPVVEPDTDLNENSMSMSLADTFSASPDSSRRRLILAQMAELELALPVLKVEDVDGESTVVTEDDEETETDGYVSFTDYKKESSLRVSDRGLGERRLSRSAGTKVWLKGGIPGEKQEAIVTGVDPISGKISIKVDGESSVVMKNLNDIEPYIKVRPELWEGDGCPVREEPRQDAPVIRYIPNDVDIDVKNSKNEFYRLADNTGWIPTVGPNMSHCSAVKTDLYHKIRGDLGLGESPPAPVQHSSQVNSLPPPSIGVTSAFGSTAGAGRITHHLKAHGPTRSSTRPEPENSEEAQQEESAKQRLLDMEASTRLKARTQLGKNTWASFSWRDREKAAKTIDEVGEIDLDLIERAQSFHSTKSLGTSGKMSETYLAATGGSVDIVPVDISPEVERIFKETTPKENNIEITICKSSPEEGKISKSRSPPIIEVEKPKEESPKPHHPTQEQVTPPPPPPTIARVAEDDQVPRPTEHIPVITKYSTFGNSVPQVRRAAYQPCQELTNDVLLTWVGAEKGRLDDLPSSKRNEMARIKATHRAKMNRHKIEALSPRANTQQHRRPSPTRQRSVSPRGGANGVTKRSVSPRPGNAQFSRSASKSYAAPTQSSQLSRKRDLVSEIVTAPPKAKPTRKVKRPAGINTSSTGMPKSLLPSRQTSPGRRPVKQQPIPIRPGRRDTCHVPALDAYVRDWLCQHGMIMYAEEFAKYKVDKNRLPHLTRDDLTFMGLPRSVQFTVAMLLPSTTTE